MRIIFFGTSNFALPILEALHTKHTVVAVVTTPDAPAGRKKIMAESPVALLAKDLSLKTLKPDSLKNNQVLEHELKSLAPDLAVVAAYGKIIPESLLGIPVHGTINVHPSLLPKYRGASPIQYALRNGDNETGTTIMRVDVEVDHGAILAQEHTPIAHDDTFLTLQDSLSRQSANLVLQVIEQIEKSALNPQEQDHTQASFTKMITKADGQIDWTQPAQAIYNQFRAFYPWPGLWTTWNDQQLAITGCTVANDETTQNPVGTILAGGLVQCGLGQLQITNLQLAGKNETDITNFLNGYPQFVGSQLGM